MELEIFQKQLLEKIREAAEERIGEGYAFETEFKEDGVFITVTSRESGLAGITVNTVDYYAAFQAGRPMESVVEAAVSALNESLSEQKEQILLERMAKPENIVPVLLPGKGNAELLEKVPHKAFCNMEIIFKFMLPEPVDGMNVFCSVPRSYMEEQGWDEEKLLALAMGSRAYQEHLHAMPFRKMADALLTGKDADGLGSDWEGIKGDSMKMVLITNSLRTYGASGILDEDTVERISGIYGENLYLLLPSVHECLAVPEGAMPPEDLREMLQKMNQGNVSREEWLSDDVYIFDRRTKEIRIVEGETKEN